MFAVLIDDFVFNGNEQLLVVMDGKCHVMSHDLIKHLLCLWIDPISDDFSLSNFALTDLETIEIPSPQVRHCVCVYVLALVRAGWYD